MSDSIQNRSGKEVREDDLDLEGTRLLHTENAEVTLTVSNTISNTSQETVAAEAESSSAAARPSERRKHDEKQHDLPDCGTAVGTGW